MDKIIIIRYGELHLKGKNRSYFENALKNDIRGKLKDFGCRITFDRSRYIISDIQKDQLTPVTNVLRTVFGLHSLSVAIEAADRIEDIFLAAQSLTKQRGSFRIDTNRANKQYPLTSVEVSKRVGAYLLAQNPGLSVDLHHPDFTIYIDIRENGKVFLYQDTLRLLGGMPLGTAGKGLLMLSGGIDSPVAGFLMAKRGVQLHAIHFHSYPYTSEHAKQKVVTLFQKLAKYCGKMDLYCVPFTKIQEEIHKQCTSSYMITLIRRVMMRITEQVALSLHCGCVINGESLGQVASQTMESIAVTNSVMEQLPVLRPLIGADKQEIIDIAQSIDTFQTSILPYEDCCTVFLPDSPVTKPCIGRAKSEEGKISDLDALIQDAINGIERIVVEP